MSSKHTSTFLILTSFLLSSHLLQASTTQYLLPLLKDSTRLQYYTSFPFGTPSFPISLSLDLSNPWSWFTCNSVGNNDPFYEPVPSTTSYRPLICSNSTCDSYDSHFCYTCDYQTCASAKGQTCGAEPYGPYFYTHDVQSHLIAPLLLDTITISKLSMNNKSIVQISLPNFPFTCGYISVLKGLSQYTKGVLSLAWKDSSLHSLVSKTFNVPRKFALCLPSSSQSGIRGAVIFGRGLYFVSSSYFVTTPLVRNPVDIGVTFYKGKSSVDYFINVKSILVDGSPLKINSNLLSINKNGTGGTKLSTIDGYTVLHTQIFNALVTEFTTKAAAMNISRVAALSSFSACYNSKNIVGSKTGPKVPIIDLVLDGNSKWRIYGANSMIKVSNDVRCLAFINGGDSVQTSIVIGGKQMEDTLVEFDLELSRLGVTSSLLNLGRSCSEFKSA